MTRNTMTIELACNGKTLRMGPGEDLDIVNVSGLESSELEISTSDNALVDGASVDGKKIKPRPIHIEASFRSSKNNPENRAAVIKFFNPKYTGKATITNMGVSRNIEYELEGWTFEIVNRSDHPVLTDSAKCAPGDVVAAITTEHAGDAFVAATGERSLPFGTYEVREVGPAQPGENGYLYDAESEAWSRVFEIAEDGAVVDLTGEADACPNQVVRGDLGLVKAKGPEMNRLAGIPFKVTSTTTGEWHVMVTDRNGQASTAADFNPHTARTNANDEALSADGAVDESKLDETGSTDAPKRPPSPTTARARFPTTPIPSRSCPFRPTRGSTWCRSKWPCSATRPPSTWAPSWTPPASCRA